MHKSISSLNEEWHLKNRMPAKATLDQRIAWHIEHVEHCSCRPMPEKIKSEIKKQKNSARSK
jgi:hypothetical protein